MPELNPINPPGQYRTPGDGRLHIGFINVGTGDCTYIICPNGKRVLIDCGSLNRRGTSIEDIEAGLDYYYFDPTDHQYVYLQVDVIIFTHGHVDHNNLILEMVGASPVQRVYYGGNLQRDYSSRSFWVWLGRYYNCAYDPQPLVLNTPPAAGQPPAPILICDGTAATPGATPCSVSVYAANVAVTTPAMQANTHYSQNTSSIVTRIVFGTDTVMICGDATVDTEQFLVNTYGAAGISAQNLLVPHHGSDSSSGAAFVQATNPEFAVISCVYRPGRYNLPKKAVVDRYLAPGQALLAGQANHNIETYDTVQWAYVPTATTRNIWQTGAQNQSFNISLDGQ